MGVSPWEGRKLEETNYNKNQTVFSLFLPGKMYSMVTLEGTDNARLHLDSIHVVRHESAKERYTDSVSQRHHGA